MDFLGKGLAFPFRFDRRSGGTASSDSQTRQYQHIRESIRQILGTRLGERFMRPDFGSRLHELVFESNNALLHGLARHYITEALHRWEKRILLTGIHFDTRAVTVDQHLLPIRIDYRIIAAHVQDNLVYPFYREPQPEQPRNRHAEP